MSLNKRILLYRCGVSEPPHLCPFMWRERDCLCARGTHRYLSCSLHHI